MPNIKGETRGEYFHILCEKCGSNIYNEYLGFETGDGYSDGVPHLKVMCKECNSSKIFKLMPTDWKDIKERQKKRREKTFKKLAKMRSNLVQK